MVETLSMSLSHELARSMNFLTRNVYTLSSNWSAAIGGGAVYNKLRDHHRPLTDVALHNSSNARADPSQANYPSNDFPTPRTPLKPSNEPTTATTPRMAHPEPVQAMPAGASTLPPTELPGPTNNPSAQLNLARRNGECPYRGCNCLSRPTSTASDPTMCTARPLKL